MRILVITKRHYTNKDLITDRYGRLREVPLALAGMGHRVRGLCISYRNRPRVVIEDCSPNDAAKVIWQSVPIGRLFLTGACSYVYSIIRRIKEFKPDIIWASSDCFHIILGVSLGRYFNIPCMADLYDNYEYFARLARMPVVVPFFRKAVSKSAGVTCVSTALARYVDETCKPAGPNVVVENAVDSANFRPMDREECRKFFGLPVEAHLIGTAGALSDNRGIKVLYKAYERMVSNDPDLRLVLAGRQDGPDGIPMTRGVHYLRELDYRHIPKLFGALDVGVICNKENEFGKYCFPQKAYEMMACGIPLVAANIGAMADVLQEFPEQLFEPENAESLIKAVNFQLESPRVLALDVPSWRSQAAKLEKLAEQLCSGG